ncbi:protein TE22 [Testudinid alphaherpesvirus 3]|uniref:BRRF2-like protein n=1 Tax=Testudinid alphaherpesvirus 3 TaxID=2560801 RepID=A0A0K1R1H4_9ALPH|nr:protein TE22 [Testudinid alphaherpesvirus 3]AIU39342.1 protein TE22 [Testudinid alphaherpesvirus 3]AIU39437.1 protein TE22 [Testudinid alphaherpesvirus 3]AKI81712.1 protein TE22 [Testudinid alphaherpesvirus 3]AKI81813.1 protein TE22 [Testudinid alphaherpesvirus 3]AKV40748.1 BRRF2-like protein [Testudinid alphaherpesvirus 3]
MSSCKHINDSCRAGTHLRNTMEDWLADVFVQAMQFYYGLCPGPLPNVTSEACGVLLAEIAVRHREIPTSLLATLVRTMSSSGCCIQQLSDLLDVFLSSSQCGRSVYHTVTAIAALQPVYRRARLEQQYNRAELITLKLCDWISDHISECVRNM